MVLTLPMVLPPTVVGYFLLLLFGAKRPLGTFFMEHFGVKLVMNWYSAIFASIVVAFPLMYRTARGAFESFDETLDVYKRQASAQGASAGRLNSFSCRFRPARRAMPRSRVLSAFFSSQLLRAHR